MNFHVISHTHWDREWHQTYQQYRVKLVRFMDELIELLENTPSYTSFMLDGQTIVLEDYLEIKPHKKEAIAKLVQKERLLIGPWYIQPDEFIPSGESLVRNLLIGQKIAKDFGPSMQIGYLPDSFGQAAQIPQVLNGFGMKNALFWRGITNEETEKTEFWWEGSDGSRVLTTHLPLGYGNGVLSTKLDQNLKVIDKNISELKEITTSSNMLLMCGFDQRSAIKELPEIVDELNAHFSSEKNEYSIKISKLQDYFDEVKRESENLEVLKGEFRKGKNMRVHVSIASTRLDLKKLNFEVQNLYENYLEPINAMSHLLGNTYDNAMINQGWKYTLQNHAHDSICNVCTDATHKEMELRYQYAKQIGETLQNSATNELIEKINFDYDKGLPLIVFNTLGHKRSNLVEATVQLKSESFSLIDQNGVEIPYQVIESNRENLNDKQIEIGVKNEDQFVWTSKIKFLADVEGLGYKTFYMTDRNQHSTEDSFVYQDGVFSNDLFQVEIQSNGSLTVKDHLSDKEYKNLNLFEEGGNAGDEYDFSPPREDVIVTTKDSVPSISVVNNGPIFATVKITHELEVPVDTDVNGRTKEYESMMIDTFVTVSRHEDRIDIKTKIHNTVKNHRIRTLFETGLKTSKHAADQQFGLIQRENYLPQVEYWEEEKWEEKYYPIYPQQKYVDVSDQNRGLAILNKGLPQYEILHNEQPTIALTLLSGTDYMGKQDLVDRPGRRSGLHVETPDSSLIGIHEMEYSIHPHSGNVVDAKVGLKANEYITSLTAVQVNTRTVQSEFADHNRFFQLNHADIGISAVKKCENDDSLIIRIYNTTDCEIPLIEAQFNTDFFNDIEMVDLNENVLSHTNERIIRDNDRIELKDIKSNEIITLKLSR
ncbi:glycoside hydrolase family 38 C-terminal domain-containing protein [Fictibacillus phosphorivorans]|uniref:glycoside hydrolase family 38 N-terminal domain-containing protein n=1 Tax=Fictibacillus phosphorivorans TaxID=1221500 RepID=UPI00203AD8EA|nr:glycoside hydrolase family 38 C-terminal domain-containing protein [Fictibacillus phosphorivorans]MCM3717814.1 alpha-mannosidase [Fictibacillus phosphorivorans]MCM3777042.1 alpha-mannosidase [Fictibacillus phosphorivorans]